MVNNKIGVLGGIGPESSAEFYKKLIIKLQKRGFIKNNQDYPQIIINSINAPELVFEKINNKDLNKYVEGLNQLDRLNLDFIVIICNTIHLYYNFLKNKIKTPIIDLRKEIKKELNKKNIRKITVLGTPNTIKKDLYKFKGINIIKINKKERGMITNSVIDFNKGKNKRKQIRRIKKIIEKYKKKRAIILLGCTELAIMLKNSKDCINTIDILVESVINRLKKPKF